MKNRFKHLFFDLDHTLWDYEVNSNETLARLYGEYELQKLGIPGLPAFQEAFHAANLIVWDQFGESTLNRDQLRHKRLELVFAAFGLPNRTLEGFHEAYYERCSRGTALIPGARTVLEHLCRHYSLHIVTNGFDDAQYNKIRFTGLEGYFQTITTSENAGSKKPEPAYFSFALGQAKARPEESLVIGDGYNTDVKGAINAGLEVVWFNPSGKGNPDIRQIRALSELLEWL